MPYIIKTIFSRRLTDLEIEDVIQELKPFIDQGYTDNYLLPDSIKDKVSYRKWYNKEIAELVLEKIRSKPWCKSAGITSIVI